MHPDDAAKLEVERKKREEEIESERNRVTLDLLKKCLSPRRLLPIKYPPDFDGELHVHATPIRIGFLPTVLFMMEIRQVEGEDIWKTLVRAAQDILKQEDRAEQVRRASKPSNIR